MRLLQPVSGDRDDEQRRRRHLHDTLIFMLFFRFSFCSICFWFPQTNFNETPCFQMRSFSFFFSVNNDRSEIIILTVLIAVLTWFLLCIVYAFKELQSADFSFFLFSFSAESFRPCC